MKKTRVLAALVGALMLTMAIPFTASAHTENPSGETTETCSEESELERSLRYDQRQRQFEKLCNTRKLVSMRNDGLFYAKDVKLYGRKVIGVNRRGDFVLGGWEQLNNQTTLHGGGFEFYTFEISAEYVEFAFSYDVTWGTDYPYSGVFWTDIYNTDWELISIVLSGGCRTADTWIRINDNTIVNELDGSSHNEWRP